MRSRYESSTDCGDGTFMHQSWLERGSWVTSQSKQEMQMSKLFVVAALAATCASAVPAFAATDSECQAMWTKADANNDGVLSGPESMRYAAAMRVHNAKISEKDKITKADFMTAC